MHVPVERPGVRLIGGIALDRIPSVGGSTGSAVATGQKRSTASAMISIRPMVTATVAQMTRNALSRATKPQVPATEHPELANAFHNTHVSSQSNRSLVARRSVESVVLGRILPG